MDATPRPTLFCLHFLAGSARLWRPLASRLDATYDIVAIDLPGFGDAAATPGYSVAEMADHVARIIRRRAAARWSLAGHSMGAKIACVLARRAEDGEPGLAGLDTLILLAGSPPSPEPMEDGQRADMLTWFAGDAAARAADARRYVDNNVGAALDPDLDALVRAEILRANRAAWTAWLERGSREDWAGRIGVLQTPALLIAGSQDDALGGAAQLRETAPHLARHRLVTLPGAGHLLPQERPADVAALIQGSVPFGDSYRALIDSPRVSARTRAALLARAEPDLPGYQPIALTVPQLDILRLVLARVLPQPGPGVIDLAASIDAHLAGPGLDAAGDGWRFAALLPDAQAWSAALDGIAASGFVQAGTDRQDAMLTALAAGEGGSDLEHWFEDLRAEAVRHFVAHPSTLARMGYSGIGYGGDGPGKPGFRHLGIGQRDAWEPSRPEPARPEPARTEPA